MPARRRASIAFTILGLGAVLTVGIVAVTLSGRAERPSDTPERVPVPDVGQRVTASPALAGPNACTRTVVDVTNAAVQAAATSAGAGTICFPAGRYEGPFSATVPGQSWSLDDGAVLVGSIGIEAADVWVEGGTVELPTDDQWRQGVAVNADRATIKRVTFRGGGLVVSINGRDGTQVVDNDFSGQSGTAIFVWGEGRGADDTLIQGNVIDQASARKASPISSRAADDPSDGIVNRGITVRGNTIDQGDELTGWFGVELKLSPGAVIVDNDIRGGGTLISLPDSDGSIVSGNRLDLRGSAVWGVEIASSDGVTVEDNVFTGDGTDSSDVAVSMNSGSLQALISANRADGLRTLVDLTGNDHRITDNCVTNVRDITAFRSSAGPNVMVARNGPCS